MESIAYLRGNGQGLYSTPIPKHGVEVVGHAPNNPGRVKKYGIVVSRYEGQAPPTCGPVESVIARRGRGRTVRTGRPRVPKKEVVINPLNPWDEIQNRGPARSVSGRISICLGLEQGRGWDMEMMRVRCTIKANSNEGALSRTTQLFNLLTPPAFLGPFLGSVIQ
jgi:hypothetical protein